MRRFKVYLNAGQSQNLSISGDYVRVISADSQFQIQPDTSHALAGMQSGMAYETEKTFKGLELVSEVSQQVEIMAGLGRVQDNRTRIEGAVSITDTVSTAETGTVDSYSKGASIAAQAHTVGIAAALMLAADATRRSVLIKNRDTTESVFIGEDGTLTTGNGFEIEPGQMIGLDAAAGAALYAIAGAAGVDVRTFAEFD